ncbi:MAG: ribosome-associated translation inhibitor RaiA [Pseudonocardiales bacterium]|nr:ribosome-associated translation inhibitor RaiA [Pseudonocardiales bacterium]MBV9729177.1 ribosome-associated translation inhibitor RaiA [Pseudonocardiales bacterium]
MNIVVKGRNVEVPDHYRVHVTEKLAHVERYDHKAVQYDVELFHERNPRQSKSCQRVEITGRCRGQVVRAEASGSDFYAALDAAVSKLDNRLRRVADRRKVHYGRRNPTSVAEATAPLAATLTPEIDTLDTLTEAETNGHRRQMGLLDLPNQEFDYELPTQRWKSPDEQGPGRIVRRKRHSARPMTVDEALYEMELVGHDFYLFFDVDSGLPSVVYRRHGFDYGVIQLS